MGASLTSIFVVYTGESIVRVFFITAATFAATSLYGYTTKSDLSRMGSFMMMGLFGIIIASLVNMFMQSSALQFAISIIGVVVFVGLTAWDTQRIKADYVQYAYAEGTELAAQTRGLRRAEPVSELHQPVHVPAADHGRAQQQLTVRTIRPD